MHNVSEVPADDDPILNIEHEPSQPVETKDSSQNLESDELRNEPIAGSEDVSQPPEKALQSSLIAWAMTITACVLLAVLPALAADVEFNRDIRPILSDNCFTCHGPDAANRKTPVRFDIEESARRAIVRRRSRRQPALQAHHHPTTKRVRMPPAYAGKAKLPDREIDTIRRWIEQGAKWQQHWSFIPPVRPVQVRALAENAIDSFVWRASNAKG